MKPQKKSFQIPKKEFVTPQDSTNLEIIEEWYCYKCNKFWDCSKPVNPAEIYIECDDYEK